MELWHDVGGYGWEGGEEYIVQRGGAVGRSTYCFYEDLMRAWVDIRPGGVRGELVAAGAGVVYCGIFWGKEGVCCGATGRGRQTRFSS